MSKIIKYCFVIIILSFFAITLSPIDINLKICYIFGQLILMCIISGDGGYEWTF